MENNYFMILLNDGESNTLTFCRGLQELSFFLLSLDTKYKVLDIQNIGLQVEFDNRAFVKKSEESLEIGKKEV